MDEHGTLLEISVALGALSFGFLTTAQPEVGLAPIVISIGFISIYVASASLSTLVNVGAIKKNLGAWAIIILILLAFSFLIVISESIRLGTANFFINIGKSFLE